MSENDFDEMSYAARVMRCKGYDPAEDEEVTDIFELQWPGWRELIAKHRIGQDPSRAEQLLTGFMQRELKGGATRVLETFAAHLDAQPRQGGSPDWSKAGREWRECAYCDGRGVVSEIPVKIERRGETIDRTYSFACVCDNGRRFAGVKVAEDWMIRLAADRKSAQIARHQTALARYGIDPNADPQTRARQFRAAILRMRQQVGTGAATAKTATPNNPQTVDEARAMLARRKPRKPSPPPQLNPEALALAVFDNGDERNEWE